MRNACKYQIHGARNRSPTRKRIELIGSTTAPIFGGMGGGCKVRAAFIAPISLSLSLSHNIHLAFENFNYTLETRAIYRAQLICKRPPPVATPKLSDIGAEQSAFRAQRAAAAAVDDNKLPNALLKRHPGPEYRSRQWE